MLKLSQWVQDKYAVEPWWTVYQFDAAVTWFGRWMDNKLSELDKTTGKQIYSLNYLLAEPINSITDEVRAHLEKHPGLGRIRKSKGA